MKSTLQIITGSERFQKLLSAVEPTEALNNLTEKMASNAVNCSTQSHINLNSQMDYTAHDTKTERYSGPFERSLLNKQIAKMVRRDLWRRNREFKAIYSAAWQKPDMFMPINYETGININGKYIAYRGVAGGAAAIAGQPS